MKRLLWFFFMCDVILAISVSATFGAIKLVPSGYATIQEAIDVTIVGDTVLVDEGLYLERIDFTGKDIFVTSQYLFTGDSATSALSPPVGTRRARPARPMLSRTVARRFADAMCRLIAAGNQKRLSG